MKSKYLKQLAVLAVLVAALLTSPVMADEYSYPPNNPRVSVTFPKSWAVEPEGSIMHAGPSDRSIYFGLLPLPDGVSAEEAGQAIGQGIDNMVTDFEQVGEDGSFESNGITFFYLDATGKDKDSGQALNISLAYFSPDGDVNHMMAIVYFGTAEAEAKHEEDLQKVIQSIKNPNN